MRSIVIDGFVFRTIFLLHNSELENLFASFFVPFFNFFNTWD